jgi:hypothetical protein
MESCEVLKGLIEIYSGLKNLRVLVLITDVLLHEVAEVDEWKTISSAFGKWGLSGVGISLC